MSHDRFTRLLHLLIAVGIVAQLVGSMGMVHPKPGRAGDALYVMHEIWGQVLLGILIVHWVWSWVRSGSVPIGQLVPWFSGQRCRAVWEDIKNYGSHAVRFRLPEATHPTPLPSAVQGLGLIAATVLGVSGTLLYFYMDPTVKMVGWLHDIKEMHEAVGVMLWIYLVTHAVMGMLHQWVGHESLWAMVKVWKKYPLGAAVLLAMIFFLPSPVWAGRVVDDLLAGYRSEGAVSFNAEQGRELFNRVNSGEGGSCVDCHSANPAQSGKHLKTGKPIEPLAPSANKERLQDAAKVEKWFGRNCKGTLGRDCSPQEKGDFLTYLLTIQ
ncbi:MAG: DUF1924 domain-containing protein [Magnetococcales bacterium]|nr:DUF1924 domain-containing protein [Magnetococcales bacterium]